MSERIFQYVRHPDVAAYTEAGWIKHPSLEGTHHGDWSALMEWGGPGEPVIPQRAAAAVADVLWGDA